MPSPFPGMNPYLERRGVWEMFHTQFLSAVQEDLHARARPKYRVKLETRVLVREHDDDTRPVGEADWPMQLPAGNTRSVAVYAAGSRALVTRIELVSTSDKTTADDRHTYLTTQRDVLRSPAHLVELDLLRGGRRMSLRLPSCDYYALVSRVGERPRSSVWPWRLREPMPVILIPLRAPDPDLTLDLKARLDETYDRGGYADDAYESPPEPRLSPDDATWAAQFIPSPPE